MGRWGGGRKEKERKRVSLWKAGRRRNTEEQRPEKPGAKRRGEGVGGRGVGETEIGGVGAGSRAG